MKKSTSVVIAVALAIVLVLGTCAVQYNSLVKRSEGVAGAWSQVENVLQRRADLVPNLVETVRGYAAHEREVFTDVANARALLLAAHAPAQAEAADLKLQSALGRLLAISERYPELKANENFLRLQDELAGTENRIAVERMRYNERVRDYNTRIRRFPSNLVASAAGFDHRDYFEASPGSHAAPRVQFNQP
jgi:LemA protein